MLDNFRHIKTFWIMNTIEISQVALWYGADDIDGNNSGIRNYAPFVFRDATGAHPQTTGRARYRVRTRPRRAG